MSAPSTPSGLARPTAGAEGNYWFYGTENPPLLLSAVTNAFLATAEAFPENFSSSPHAEGGGRGGEGRGREGGREGIIYNRRCHIEALPGRGKIDLCSALNRSTADLAAEELKKHACYKTLINFDALSTRRKLGKA